MDVDFTALASRVATRADVLGCLILSRDGLVLGSFPPHGERDVTPAWLAFSRIGDPERGFVAFAEEIWAYAAHEGYAAFAVAVPSARPGIVIDMLEQVLMEVGDSRERRDAVRPPETVNLPPAAPVEDRPGLAPPQPPTPQHQRTPAAPGSAEAESGSPAKPENAEEPASSGAHHPEDVDRVALAREFADLLQENPLGAEEPK
jgi:hypothetical protein